MIFQKKKITNVYILYVKKHNSNHNNNDDDNNNNNNNKNIICVKDSMKDAFLFRKNVFTPPYKRLAEKESTLCRKSCHIFFLLFQNVSYH